MPKKKRLQHRIVTVWIETRNAHLTPVVRIERDDVDHTYMPDVFSKMRLQRLLNSPGVTCDIDLFSCTVQYYFLRNIEYDEPEECDCKLPEEVCERCTINGETHQIPY